MSVMKDLTGQTFGQLTAMERTGRTDPRQRAYWKCKCLCGRTIEVRGDNLRRGISTKCSWCNNGMGRGSRELL